MPYIKCEPSDTIDLSIAIDDGSTGLYPQAKVYDISGNLIATVNLTHIANGLYQGSYAPDGTYKHLTAHYRIYTDSGHTALSDYAAVSDKIYVAYDYKPSFGGVSQVKLTEKDFEGIAKKIWESEKFDELLKAIERKSEFDPEKDIVRTDIKIPQVNLRDIRDSLDSILRETKKRIPKEKDYLMDFQKIERLVRGIRIPQQDLSPVISALNNVKKAVDSKNYQFDSQDIVKVIPVLLSLKKDFSDNEKMLEALNAEEERRNGEIKKLVSAIYAFIRFNKTLENIEGNVSSENIEAAFYELQSQLAKIIK